MEKPTKTNLTAKGLHMYVCALTRAHLTHIATHIQTRTYKERYTELHPAGKLSVAELSSR